MKFILNFSDQNYKKFQSVFFYIEIFKDTNNVLVIRMINHFQFSCIEIYK